MPITILLNLSAAVALTSAAPSTLSSKAADFLSHPTHCAHLVGSASTHADNLSPAFSAALEAVLHKAADPRAAFAALVQACESKVALAPVRQ